MSSPSKGMDLLSMPQGPLSEDVKWAENFIKFLRNWVHEEIEFIPVQHIQNIYPGFEVPLRKGGFSFLYGGPLEPFPRRGERLKTYLSLVKANRGRSEILLRDDMDQKGLLSFLLPKSRSFPQVESPIDSGQPLQGGEIKMALHNSSAHRATLKTLLPLRSHRNQ